MLSYRVREHGAPSTMKIETLPNPIAGKSELVIDVKTVGINFPDTLMVSGQYQALPPRPFTPGTDLAGLVRAVGPGVSGFAVGDRVMAQVEHGAFAEQSLAEVNQTYKLPEGMPFETAAALGLVYQAAHFALMERGQYKSGETVLIGGAAGGVGLAAVQIAKAYGARVLAAVRSEEEAAVVVDAGADAVIDLSAGDLHESLRAQVHAVSDGRGANVVLDPLGGEFFRAALRATAWSGRIVVVGFASGDIPSVKVNYLLVKNIGVCGMQLGDYRNRMPERIHTVQAELFDLWRTGSVAPHIMRVFPFGELPDALELIAQGKVRGKAVVQVTDDGA